ncbi:MAG: ral secretion pathway protein [Frankiaceae bacterium]|jgi:general secretion pathway protein G|nr:ral secretion pathway protein [Frankiaceae bacterium]MDX6224779.1 ral secretion pathway protein [Frankiales bacterium]MDX6275644.1 ral secretion pathway protein [Frankiales bacterium]
MYQRLSKRLGDSRQSGFTLIELLIVIAILGILAGIVIFAVGNSKSDADTAACSANKKTVATAAEAYKAKTGAYPATIDASGFLTDTSSMSATATASYSATTGRISAC